jgi:hypothetical protein
VAEDNQGDDNEGRKVVKNDFYTLKYHGVKGLGYGEVVRYN